MAFCRRVPGARAAQGASHRQRRCRQVTARAGSQAAAGACEAPLFFMLRCISLRTTLPSRVFGPNFAEIPYLATKDGYRREGNCRRLGVRRSLREPCQAAGAA